MTKKDLNIDNFLHALILGQETCEKGFSTISIEDAIDVAKLYGENIIAEIQLGIEEGFDIDYILEDVFSKLQKK
jgi:transcriptional regulator